MARRMAGRALVGSALVELVAYLLHNLVGHLVQHLRKEMLEQLWLVRVGHLLHQSLLEKEQGQPQQEHCMPSNKPWWERPKMLTRLASSTLELLLLGLYMAKAKLT